MNKQLILIVAGVALIASLLFFGRTASEKSKQTTAKTQMPAKAFDMQHFIADEKQKLTPSQNTYVSQLENSVTRGDVHSQQIEAYKQLAGFWKDSAKVFEPYAYYISAAAKLDNSEKNLTFAAQLILAALRGEQDEAKINWEAQEAITLFEKAIQLNPNNDTLKVGLGSCYVFGKGRFGGPEETMKGIQQLLEVVRRDSTNMQAQLVLAVGGYTSGQYDKAVERFLKVIKAEPDNLEAIAFLADTYAAKGDKAEAIKWYKVSKRMANNPHYNEEVDQRLKQLQ